MSEFDELVSRKGVLVAGRFGPDWSVAEQKSASLAWTPTLGLGVNATWVRLIRR